MPKIENILDKYNVPHGFHQVRAAHGADGQRGVRLEDAVTGNTFLFLAETMRDLVQEMKDAGYGNYAVPIEKALAD
jgi:hypothetical protein